MYLLYKFARKALSDLTLPYHGLSIVVQLCLLHKYARKVISDLTLPYHELFIVVHLYLERPYLTLPGKICQRPALLAAVADSPSGKPVKINKKI
jgi:hypothetical protein